jgi:hypothetical protein
MLEVNYQFSSVYPSGEKLSACAFKTVPKSQIHKLKRSEPKYLAVNGRKDKKKDFIAAGLEQFILVFYTEMLEVMVTTVLPKNVLEFCSGVCYAKGALEIGSGIQHKVFGVMSFY